MKFVILALVFITAVIFFSWPAATNLKTKEVTVPNTVSEVVVELASTTTKNTDTVPKPEAVLSDEYVEDEVAPVIDSTAYRITKSISYNEVKVDVIIDKPANNQVDVLMVYHGTSMDDDKIIDAADFILDKFKSILDRNDMMIVSVAYPEEGLLLGDNIAHSEAALLWVKNKAAAELGVSIGKIFLAGHSQGGYLVTRLNTMHMTDGVIANAPGPLNLGYRCGLEESKKIPEGITCQLLGDAYGSTASNEEAYSSRSLLNFTDG